MADPREVMPILEDGSDVGDAPDKAINDTTSGTSIVGLTGFAFKDSSGNVTLPALNASGQVQVSTADPGTCLHANGELAAGSLSLVDVTSASITLTVTKVYTKIGWNVSCLRSSLFQLQHVDDSGGTPVVTVIDEILVGAGNFTHCCQLDCTTLDTTGGTGVILLRVQAMNFIKLSSLRATIACLEPA